MAPTPRCPRADSFSKGERDVRFTGSCTVGIEPSRRLDRPEDRDDGVPGWEDQQADILEGPAGAGKTELAQSVARAAGADLLRLLCYQGVSEEKAIGQFDKSLQELFILLRTKAEDVYDWDQIRKEVTSRKFFLAGPLLTAIEQDKRLRSADR